MSTWPIIYILCEGQTEERFVKEVLKPHLGKFNKEIRVSCVITSRKKHKKHKGGLTNYAKPQKDILDLLKEWKANPSFYLTTMFDFYALPNEFPNYELAQKQTNPYQKVRVLEDGLKSDIAKEGYTNFIPYIQLHEFEAIVLIQPTPLIDAYPDKEKEITQLSKLKEAFDNNPELINGGDAPSKRILDAIPEYDKVGIGIYVSELAGIETIKSFCPHFKEWVEKLENL